MLNALAKSLLLAALLLSSACSSMIDTAAVVSDAGDVKRCQDSYRDAADRWAYETCLGRSQAGGDARLSGF
ncbi:MAG: hypothetical protein ABL957_00660 [Parvularculaceae bacterium]